MNKIFLFSVFTVLSVLTACNFLQKEGGGENAEKQVDFSRPNVLFISVDDLKPLLGCYGDTIMHTPNIDKIAESGTVFLNNHCQVAVCGASRASLLTGKYPDHLRVWGFEKMRDYNPDVITLPQHFRNSGYKTINLGKIFDYRTVDRFSDSLSWDHVFPVEEEDYYPHYSKETGIAQMYHYQAPYVKKKYQQYKEEALAAGKDSFAYAFKKLSPAVECDQDVPDDAYKDGIFGKLGVDAINEAGENKETPFFLAVGFHKPHLPFNAPKRYWDLYNDTDIPLARYQKYAKNSVDYAYHTSGELRNYTDSRGNPIYDVLKEGENLPEKEQYKLVRGYMAAVSYVDAQIGKLMDALEDQGLLENTIIVVWGDHGFHLGDHGMWCKHSTFEQATHSPLIISKPGGAENTTEAPTGFIDLYPTICDLAGLEVPHHLDGQSLTGLMHNKAVPRDYVVSQWRKGDKMGYALRNKRFRYVEWIEQGLHVTPDVNFSRVDKVQLFDYKKDPHETMNVADQSEYRDVREKMETKIQDFYDKLEVN